jgi:predicted protein tyrosine phosphatase
MTSPAFSLLTVCGIEELPLHRDRAVSHVLSIIDPDRADPDAFEHYADHRRVTLRFHDDIAPLHGRATPQPAHVDEILRFGDACARDGATGHLLVHCHMGVSRSTAAMLTLMAQAAPQEDADALFMRLHAIRAQAWPNSRMVAFADEALGRKGALMAALRRHYGRQLAANPDFTPWMASLGRHAELEMAAPV